MAKEVNPNIEAFARIKVVGIGGAGGSAVSRMVDSGLKDLEFIVINTDAQALHHNVADRKLHIGKQTTRGLGAGADPKVGQDAAKESVEEIKEVIQGADILFLALGAGGGTGSGACHVVAEIARELGILTVAFVTKPFGFEGERRQRNAEFAISNLEKFVDALVLIPNDNLLEAIDHKTPLTEAFKIADDVLRQGVQGVADLITVPGLINLDFADVKAVVQNSGQALMGIGRASGENRAVDAAKQAINSPLLELSIDGARGILFNVIGGSDMAMHEIDAAAGVITEAADQDANVIFGATINPDLEGEIIITVVATGFNERHIKARPQADEPELQETSKPISKNLNPKITSVDELPSLKPTKKNKTSSKSKAQMSDTDEDISLNEIVKDIDVNLDKEVNDSSASPEKNILEEDQDNSGSIWDDVEVDEDQDLNKPTFLRKLSKRRTRRGRGGDSEVQQDKD